MMNGLTISTISLPYVQVAVWRAKGVAMAGPMTRLPSAKSRRATSPRRSASNAAMEPVG